jgi:hypothetical protein
MASAISTLYEPMIGRDLEAIPSAVLRFRKTHKAGELFDAVTRFAVLSFSPSQHGKHAVLACLAAHHIREEMAEHFDQIMAECAIYAAQSRLPWSEPPITDPPPTENEDPWTDDEIRAAIAEKDRMRGEKWLARRMREPNLESSFFRVAAEDLSDQGHKLIVAAGAWELAELLGDRGAFATLRIAPIEWTAYSGDEAPPPPERQVDLETALRILIDLLVEEGGSTIAYHRIALFDAALRASRISELPLEEAVRDWLLGGVDLREPSDRTLTAVPRAPVYRLARDYGGYLQAHAIFRRLRHRFPRVDCRRILSATKFNLDHGPSFEDWSFA